MNDLNQTLIAITRLQAAVIPFSEPGPNSWDEVTQKDFGPEHDYTVTTHRGVVVIDWVSEAGKQWLYAHFPADASRWGKGFIVDEKLDVILAAADRDGLMSEEQFDEAMYGEENLRRDMRDLGEQ